MNNRYTPGPDSHELYVTAMEDRHILTTKERAAIDTLLKAVKALPASICIKVEDAWDDEPGEPNFKVSKRITAGCSEVVASLRKPSLSF